MRRGKVEIRHVIPARQICLRDLPAKMDPVHDTAIRQDLTDLATLGASSQQNEIHRRVYSPNLNKRFR